MSTQAKRVVRPVKPKVVAPSPSPAPDASTPPAEVQSTAPVTTPTPEPLPVVIAEPTSKRQQTGKAVGINISPARVRRHIDKLNLNHAIDKIIGELKDQLTAFKLAKSALDSGKLVFSVHQLLDGKTTTVEQTRDLTTEERATYQATFDRLSPSVRAFEMKVIALSRERTRFSNEASIALSIICDELIQQLTEHSMAKVLAAKKKIIQINHLHEAGVEKLSLYPLIKSLPSFVSTADKLSSSAHSELSSATLAAALAQAEKDFKKKYSVHAPKKKKAEAAVQPPADTPHVEQPIILAEVAVEADPDLEDEDTSDSKTSFRFYVGQVCKEIVKKDPRYKAVRVSTEIRSYLSDLLVELIQRLSSLVHLTATSMKNKTINDVAILRTVESLLIDGHASVETLEFKDELVYDPDVLKAESSKKEEEKKAGREYKVDLEKVPKVPGFVASRTITYPTSGYAALAKKVNDKLELYESLSEKDKETVTSTVETV